MVQRLKIAAAGLGRMGARHAINFLHRTPRAELVAAFTPDPKELAWARVNLEPHGVKLYTDYDEMIKQEGLQAVVIGTATSVHAEEAIKAMHQGLHVLVEKPLSTSIPIVSFHEADLMYTMLISRSVSKSSMRHSSTLT
jgi:myo-inositol 2-dehydrogenase/D-chiro-inositol 1-dehydrogenase